MHPQCSSLKTKWSHRVALTGLELGYVDQAGLCPQALGLKVCAAMPGPAFFLQMPRALVPSLTRLLNLPCHLKDLLTVISYNSLCLLPKYSPYRPGPARVRSTHGLAKCFLLLSSSSSLSRQTDLPYSRPLKEVVRPPGPRPFTSVMVSIRHTPGPVGSCGKGLVPSYWHYFGRF